MDSLRNVRAEWPVLRIRLLRTRLGLWLLLLTGVLLWIGTAAPPPDPSDLAVRAGGYAAVLCVCYVAGSGADRVALALSYLHRIAPGAMAVGRWSAATAGAGLVVAAVAAGTVWKTGAVAPGVRAAVGGCVAAGAVAAAALAMVWSGGNVLGAGYLLWLVFFGQVNPEVVLGAPHAGPFREALATALAILPGLWRYREVSHGAPGALLHAAAWIVTGLAVARWRAARLGARP